MSVNERPGVYSSYEVTSSLRGSGIGRAVGVAAVASAGTKGVVTAFSGYAEAAVLYGPNSNLSRLVKTLLENGAPMIYAVPVVTSGTAAESDYSAAFAALMKESSIGYMICDSQSTQIHKAMRDAINTGNEQTKYRIGIVESSGTAAALCAAAAALNCERMVLVGNAISDGNTGCVAAAVTGAIAGQSDPALPLNGAPLHGLGTLASSFTDGEIGTLIRGGVTPVESIGGAISVVRGVTTRTKT